VHAIAGGRRGRDRLSDASGIARRSRRRAARGVNAHGQRGCFYGDKALETVTDERGAGAAQHLTRQRSASSRLSSVSIAIAALTIHGIAAAGTRGCRVNRRRAKRGTTVFHPPEAELRADRFPPVAELTLASERWSRSAQPERLAITRSRRGGQHSGPACPGTSLHPARNGNQGFSCPVRCTNSVRVTPRARIRAKARRDGRDGSRLSGASRSTSQSTRDRSASRGPSCDEADGGCSDRRTR
jgi:hypothetical protein